MRSWPEFLLSVGGAVGQAHRFMSLLLATLLTGLVLLAVGGWFLWNGPQVRPATFAWLRSMPAAVVLFGGAAVWFWSGACNAVLG